LQYTTSGGAGEHTTASGALMVPGGSDARCSGARPIVLYAHATHPQKSYNLAAMSDNGNPATTEGLTLAALFAAQGYIVVAPNYAGYDSSTLGYHPFLNAKQQSGEMIDALAAAKAALPVLGARVSAGSKLFVTGYSEGGHVAMATQRALQQAGVRVTAAAPMSGPYALAQELDDNFAGQVHVGSTLFGTMIATSFQKSYGNVYARTTDLYESAYAAGIEALIPGADAGTLASTGKLPETALFSATPPQAPAGSGLQAGLNAITPATGTAMDFVFARGFGSGNLFTNSARLDYLLDLLANPAAPHNGLRADAKINDLRGWTPLAPVLLCGGAQGASVSFDTNTRGMQRQWSALPAALVTVVDVDDQPDTVADPFIAEKLAFGALKGAIELSAQLQGLDPAWELARSYHPAVFPFCASAAKRFFSIF
jgi:alpha/beta superfamily hydrolase